MTVRQARELATKSTLSLDLILAELGVTHEEYRKVYPDTPITPAIAYDIRDASEEGMTGVEIRRKWSLTQSQFNYAMYNDNATIPKPIATSTVDTVLQNNVLAAVMKGGQSQTAIGEHHGVSQAYVHKLAKEHNLLDPNRKKRIILTAHQWRDIVNEADNGTSIEKLAKEYGVSRDTIYKYLRSIKP